MFPHKQELKLKNKINNNTKHIISELEKYVDKSEIVYDEIIEEYAGKFIDDLVQSTVDFAYFNKEEWEKVLGGTLPSSLNKNDTQKWLIDNLVYYRETPEKAVEKLNNIRYNRTEEFRKELNSTYNLRIDRAELRDLEYIKIQLKNTKFDFNEWNGLRTDIDNLSNFSKEDLQGLKEWFYRRNELWARNESGNLYAMQSEEMAILTGVKKFRWITEKDSRVRETHKELDGRIIEFDKAEFLPGQEPLCRCHLIPIKNS